MLKKATIFIPALLLASLTGCSWNRYQEVKDTNLIEESQKATCELREKLSRIVPPKSIIIVSTLLNVDNLNQTSAFGRIISEQIGSAFHDAGHEIIGMEMPIDLFVMKDAGELALSDETKALIRKHQAAVLVVGGVYAPGKKNSYVSLRVVDVYTKRIISTYDFSVPMGPDAKLLLEPRPVATTESTEPAEKVDDATSENSATPESAPTAETEKPKAEEPKKAEDEEF